LSASRPSTGESIAAWTACRRSAGATRSSLGILSSECQDAQHFIGSDEPVAIEIPLAEFREVSALLFPLPQGYLGIAVQVVFLEPVGNLVAELPCSQDDNLFVQFRGRFLLNPISGAVGASNVSRPAHPTTGLSPVGLALRLPGFQVFLELFAVNQAILVGVPLVAFRFEVF
jgi:hypothetical protein